MQLTLSEIKQMVDQLAEKIGAPQSSLPTYGYSTQTGRPHIEVDSKDYHFVVAERGQENRRLTTPDIDDLLYDIFQSVTFGLACSYELDHRIRGQDFRRMMFERQEELLWQLSPQWRDRRRTEHAQILRAYPFDDI